MKNPNIIQHDANVTREKRNQLNGHKSVVIWLTGLSGSGKSTLAHSVEEELHNLNCRTYVLDGDNIRQGLSSNLSFSDEDRKENIRRIGETAKLMMEAGIIVLTAFISPFEKDRNLVRKSLFEADFVEIFCSASLEVCESRDVKGFYKRARKGEIKDFTGISSPFEAPENPAIRISTSHKSVEENVEELFNFVMPKIKL